MGTIKQGILGGFSGKVGTVIGGSWKGIAYMRSIAQSVKNPRSTKQVAHRAKFIMLIDLLKQFSDFIAISFKEYAKKMSEFNAAFQINYNNGVISDTYPNLTVDASKLVVARGSLTGVPSATAEINSGMIKTSWTDNTGEGDASADDKVLLVFYNTAKDQIVANANTGKTRSNGSYSTTIVEAWGGDTVACYLAFRKADGSAVSDSVYAGTVTHPSE